MFYRNLLYAKQIVMNSISLIFIAAFLIPQTHAQSKSIASSSDRVLVNFDLSKSIGPMYPAWAWFGYDEPKYTYMKDGKKLLSEIAALSPVPVYVRTHSLLVTGDGTANLKWGSTNAYTED